MFDMGPYYLTALVTLLGPIRRLTGSARISFPERTISSAAKQGQKITVDVPTHIAGVMDFSSGAIGTLVTSFDVWAANVPRIEIYGTEGSLSVPDPNGFGGPVLLWQPDTKEWRDVPVTRSLRREQPGHRRRRHGLRRPFGPPAPGERRAGLPCFGGHARLP